MELWKPQLHLNMPFVEPGTDTGVPVRAAAYDFPLRVTAKVAIRENFSRNTAQSAAEQCTFRSTEDGRPNKCGRIPESARKDEKFLILCTRSEFFQNQLPVHIF